VRSAYLEEAMAAQRRHLEERRTEYDERVFRGEEQFRLQRDETLRRIEELERRRQAKLEAFRHLGVVHQDPEVERAAMAFVMRYERERGREPEDVSARHDGSGFDVRSVERTPAGERVCRIEVKGRWGPPRAWSRSRTPGAGCGGCASEGGR